MNIENISVIGYTISDPCINGSSVTFKVWFKGLIYEYCKFTNTNTRNKLDGIKFIFFTDLSSLISVSWPVQSADNRFFRIASWGPEALHGSVVF
jgi:hypothetical protein